MKIIELHYASDKSQVWVNIKAIAYFFINDDDYTTVQLLGNDYIDVIEKPDQIKALILLP